MNTNTYNTNMDTTAPATPHEMDDKSKKSVFLTGPAGSPHFIRTLERDQNEFRRLRGDFLASPSLKDKDTILNELVRGLSINDYITERHLYPTVAAEVPSDGKGLAERFRGRAADLRKILVSVDKMKIDDPALEPTLATYFSGLEELMNLQQTELFPALQNALTPAKAEQLGKDLDGARGKAPTRPHPNAATSSVLGALAAPIDKLKDAGRQFAGSSKETQDVLGK